MLFEKDITLQGYRKEGTLHEIKQNLYVLQYDSALHFMIYCIQFVLLFREARGNLRLSSIYLY